jgi:hypothetical protein
MNSPNEIPRETLTEIDIVDVVTPVSDETLLNNTQASSQNTKQQMQVTAILALEVYKALTGCLLLLFVPQNCNDELCSMSDIMNFSKHSLLYNGTLCFNSVSFLVLLWLYAIEVRRERALIKYLEVNPEKARDNDSVKEELSLNLPKERFDTICKNRQLYGRTGKIMTLFFIANTVMSGLSLYPRQMGSKTLSVFLTNVLFTSTKISNVYGIVSADPYVFYSAYMTRRIQFNDVEPEVICGEQVSVCKQNSKLDNDNNNLNNNS